MFDDGIPSLLSMLGMGRSKKNVKRINMYQTQQPSSGGIPLNATQAGRGALADLYTEHKQNLASQPGPTIQRRPEEMSYEDELAANAAEAREKQSAEEATETVRGINTGMMGSRRYAPTWGTNAASGFIGPNDEEPKAPKTWGR